MRGGRRRRSAGESERQGGGIAVAYRTVVTKRELSQKAKLSVYRAIFVPTLTYGHEVWVMTERIRLRIQVFSDGWLASPLEIR